jgi:two-component system, OmpR family, sensor kinase
MKINHDGPILSIREGQMEVYQNRGDVIQRQDRLLTTLEGLLELPATEVNTTLNQVAQLVAEVLMVEKVDVFFYDQAKETLIALGNSDTPMGRKQRAIGMDQLPLANGGCIVEVFLTGTSYFTGHADQDPRELVGLKVGLGIQSEIATVFQVKQQHRGVLMAASSQPEFFSQQDLHFLEAVARWIGILVGRTEVIERMRQEAVEQGRRLAAEELLTIMAHDLRNYLTPLRWRLELLERRAHREAREQDTRDAQLSLHTLGLLERGIADLLDITRLNQGIFVITPVPMDLVNLLQEVMTPFRTEETPIDIQAPAELLLSADPDRLRQLLETLLTNVIKYAAKRTPIRVRLSREQRADGAWVILTLSNSGPGIPPDQLATLFHPFMAGSRSTRLDLGLYLANRIAQAHGGTLTMVSPEGQGLQATLTLPIEEDDLDVRDEA